MTDQFLFIQDDENLVKLQIADYAAAEVLQTLLARYPDLLPLGGNDDGVHFRI